MFCIRVIIILMIALLCIHEETTAYQAFIPTPEDEKKLFPNLTVVHTLSGSRIVGYNSYEDFMEKVQQKAKGKPMGFSDVKEKLNITIVRSEWNERQLTPEEHKPLKYCPGVPAGDLEADSMMRIATISANKLGLDPKEVLPKTYAEAEDFDFEPYDIYLDTVDLATEGIVVEEQTDILFQSETFLSVSDFSNGGKPLFKGGTQEQLDYIYQNNDIEFLPTMQLLPRNALLVTTVGWFPTSREIVRETSKTYIQIIQLTEEVDLQSTMTVEQDFVHAGLKKMMNVYAKCRRIRINYTPHGGIGWSNYNAPGLSGGDGVNCNERMIGNVRFNGVSYHTITAFWAMCPSLTNPPFASTVYCLEWFPKDEHANTIFVFNHQIPTQVGIELVTYNPVDRCVEPLNGCNFGTGGEHIFVGILKSGLDAIFETRDLIDAPVPNVVKSYMALNKALAGVDYTKLTSDECKDSYDDLQTTKQELAKELKDVDLSFLEDPGNGYTIDSLLSDALTSLQELIEEIMKTSNLTVGPEAICKDLYKYTINNRFETAGLDIMNLILKNQKKERNNENLNCVDNKGNVLPRQKIIDSDYYVISPTDGLKVKPGCATGLPEELVDFKVTFPPYKMIGNRVQNIEIETEITYRDRSKRWTAPYLNENGNLMKKYWRPLKSQIEKQKARRKKRGLPDKPSKSKHDERRLKLLVEDYNKRIGLVKEKFPNEEISDDINIKVDDGDFSEEDYDEYKKRKRRELFDKPFMFKGKKQEAGLFANIQEFGFAFARRDTTENPVFADINIEAEFEEFVDEEEEKLNFENKEEQESFVEWLKSLFSMKGLKATFEWLHEIVKRVTCFIICFGFPGSEKPAIDNVARQANADLAAWAQTNFKTVHSRIDNIQDVTTENINNLHESIEQLSLITTDVIQRITGNEVSIMTISDSLFLVISEVQGQKIISYLLMHNTLGIGEYRKLLMDVDRKTFNSVGLMDADGCYIVHAVDMPVTYVNGTAMNYTLYSHPLSDYEEGHRMLDIDYKIPSRLAGGSGANSVPWWGWLIIALVVVAATVVLGCVIRRYCGHSQGKM